MSSSGRSGGVEEADAVHPRILDLHKKRPTIAITLLASENDCDLSVSSSAESIHLERRGSSRNEMKSVQNGGPSSAHNGNDSDDVVELEVTTSTPCTTSESKTSLTNGEKRGEGGNNNTDKNKDDEVGFNLLFLTRFYRLHGLLFLSFTSLSTAVFIFLLLLCLLQEYVIYQVGLIPSRYYKVLGDKDFPGFKRQTLYAVGIILAIAFVKSVTVYITKILTVTWRQLLCLACHRLYFADIRYYQLNVLDKSIDNPDQRMTQDIDKFCTNYGEILPKLLISPFVISYYCYQAYQLTSWQGPVGCFGFFLVATVINKLVMGPIVRYVVKQEQCEGDFRFIHMLVRVNSESIAFLNASGIETVKTNAALDRLINTQHRLYFRQFFLNFSVSLFAYLGSVLSYLMLAVPIFTGRYDDLTPADLSGIISQNAFVLMYLIFSFTNLVDTSQSFAELAGVVHRISQLIEKLNAIGDFWRELFPEDYDQRTSSSLDLYDEWSKRRKHAEDIPSQSIPNGNPIPRLLPAVLLQNVTFSPPTVDAPLISNITISFSAGESVLIAGQSSAGKTSLLRVLRGLWPHTEGLVRKYYPPGPQGVMYCPQRPYMTIGTLREQVCFPSKPGTNPEAEDDNFIIYYMKLLKMSSLVDRIGGLDIPVSWSILDSLSPGEMQRLTFIRIFYHRPLIAILDEATSAIPLDMEHVVYSECQRLGITTISVGHRASLHQYHDKILTLTAEGGWTLEPIVPVPK